MDLPHSEQEKLMLSGQMYNAGDQTLVLKRLFAKSFCHQLNSQLNKLALVSSSSDSQEASSPLGATTSSSSTESQKEGNVTTSSETANSLLQHVGGLVFQRESLVKKLFGKVGKECNIGFGFDCDYGCNIELGDRVYMNSNCVILDCAKVTIGNDVLLGPGVHIYTATHPLDPNVRRNWGPEYAKSVTIHNDVWIGGGSIILPGITIGEGAVVGAGSVVTKNVEPFTVVAGNPAKFIKKVT